MQDEQRFEVVFRGETIKAFSLNEVKSLFAKMFLKGQHSSEMLDEIFSGKAFVLSKNISLSKAKAVKYHYESIGMISSIELMEEHGLTAKRNYKDFIKEIVPDESIIALRDFTFGKSTAESEGELLNKYFVSTPTYLNAKNENLKKIFYVGHRGAGKSALFNRLMFEYKNANKIILFVSPVEHSYEIFKKVEHDFYDMKTIYGIV